MKTVSADVLKRRAMALGGKVEIHGSVFNAARSEKVAEPVKKTLAPAVLVAPKAPEAPEPSKDDRTLAAIERMAKIQSQVILNMREHITAKPEAREWDFFINRDAKGDLVSIKAISK